MKCAIMQPTYLPWLGYFDLIDQVDRFVFLDTTQVQRRSWDVRNRIKTTQGELYLTIPLKKIKSRNETIYCEAKIDDEQKWRKKHLTAIELAYKKSDYFEEVYPIVNRLIETQETILGEFTINIIETLARKMGITTQLLKASELQGIKGRKDNLLVSICRRINCGEYISPQNSAAYIERGSPGGEFTKAGIKLYYRDYDHPEYSQLHGPFLAHLAVIDLLFNHGWKNSLKIIKSGRKPEIDYLTFRSSELPAD